ncbi:hypothetical protein DFJ73DRAFT_879219 [Zopfochytrium polystomum]|nr:hypothetical protein DFJ73DRAFT_879219 [Zopfochytrium polystomum]
MADVAYRNKIVAKNIAKRQAENQMPFRGFMTGHPKDSLMGLGFREVDDHDEDPTGVVGSKQSGDRSESCKGGATEANDSDLRLSKSSEEEVVESFCQVKKEGVRVMDEGKNAGTKPESSQQVTKDGYTVAEALRVEAVILLNSRRRGMLLANQQLNWATDITRKTKSAPVAGSTIAGELTCGAEAAANDERAVTAPMADGAIAKLMSDPNVVAECSVRIRSPTAVATPAQEANSASSLASSGTNKCVDMERDSPCTTPVKLASALVSIKSDYSAEEGSVVPSKGTRDNTKIRNKTDLVLRVPLTMVDVLQDRQNRFAELKPFTGATWVPVHRT